VLERTSDTSGQVPRLVPRPRDDNFPAKPTVKRPNQTRHALNKTKGT